MLTGSVLNVGGLFEIDVHVRCTTHYLRECRSRGGRDGICARDRTERVRAGRHRPGQRASATIACEAIALTPTQGGRPDPVINLSPRGALDFRVVKSQPVVTEIFPT